MKKNTLIIITGLSAGAGKTHAKNFLLTQKGVIGIKTATTRPPRSQEAPDAYFFLTENEFVAQRAEGAFFEAQQNGLYWYGTPWSELQNLAEDATGVIVCDIRGAQTFKQAFEELVQILFIDTPPSFLRARMEADGRAESEILERLRLVEEEMRRLDLPYGTIKIENDETIELFEQRILDACVASV